MMIFKKQSNIIEQLLHARCCVKIRGFQLHFLPVPLVFYILTKLNC